MTLNNPSNTSNILFFSACTNNLFQLKGTVANTFLTSNKNRAYALIMNNSNIPITLILGSSNNTAINQGILLNPGGGSFEINSQNLYVGPITALAPKDCSVSFVECTW